jgi:PEP-CTERM motif-containing protein
MYSSKSLLSMLAVGGLFVATQQAGAVVVVQNDSMVPGGLNLGETEWFEFGGPNVSLGTATSDGNTFAIFNKNSAQNAGQGFSHHLGIGDVTAVQALQDGMAIRTSAWVLSDPDNPWATQAVQGWKTEFYNVALGAFGSLDMTNETENGFGLGLIDATSAAVTTGWTQQSATFTLNDADVDFASLQEIRPVLFTGDWSGTDTDGKLFVDGFTFEVFPDLATANATSLPSNMPGGFDIAPPPDLSGDANNDGFVGIDDLNMVLGNWNAGTPPVAPGPDLLSDFSSFTLDGTYEQWATGTFTSGATDYRIEANNFGGGWKTLAAPLDASGETAITIDLDVNAADVAAGFSIVLIDADGTESVYGITGLTVGDDQTILLDLVGDFKQENAAGTEAGLDLSAITAFHIQGSFDDGNPGLAMDITFDNMALTLGGTVLIEGDINGDGFVGIDDLNMVLGTWNNGTPPSVTAVPEPASLALLGLGGLAMLRRRHA